MVLYTSPPNFIIRSLDLQKLPDDLVPYVAPVSVHTVHHGPAPWRDSNPSQSWQMTIMLEDYPDLQVDFGSSPRGFCNWSLTNWHYSGRCLKAEIIASMRFPVRNWRGQFQERLERLKFPIITAPTDAGCTSHKRQSQYAKAKTCSWQQNRNMGEECRQLELFCSCLSLHLINRSTPSFDPNPLYSRFAEDAEFGAH